MTGVERANAQALRRLFDARPVLVDCRPAVEALSLPARTLLHAGPPLGWERMCAPLQAAVLGKLRYERWAGNDDGALDLIDRGEVRLAPCHHFGAVGPMTGIITPSMPIFVIENQSAGNCAFATINEGLGKVLRFGANDETVIARLRWLETEAGPLLGAAIRRSGGLDLRVLMAQALRMGDEMHQRNVAASSLLARALLPHLARIEADREALGRGAEFIAGNDQFFLNLAMAASPAVARFVGAGVVRAPLDCFQRALVAFGERYG